MGWQGAGPSFFEGGLQSRAEWARACTMPVVFLQAGQWNWFFLRLATANRPQLEHTCTRYASLWSNSRSCAQARPGADHSIITHRKVATMKLSLPNV